MRKILKGVGQRRIAADYRSDVRKYAEGLEPACIVRVLDGIPVQLAKGTHDSQLDVENCGSSSHDALVGMEDKLYCSQGSGECGESRVNPIATQALAVFQRL